MISPRELLVNIMKDASDFDDFVLIHKRESHILLYSTSGIEGGKELLKEAAFIEG